MHLPEHEQRAAALGSRPGVQALVPRSAVRPGARADAEALIRGAAAPPRARADAEALAPGAAEPAAAPARRPPARGCLRDSSPACAWRMMAP
ncbi:hypothetical protein [Streptomyces sp. DSM 15324]|uniref:hypothetical protein n=1 Tax=Streptomyces sp. DSM 15324 TaxID=1739111 RepID=UPI000AF95736|nr:hypothetical protein [Streptomyces sp. DSM 15324]